MPLYEYKCDVCNTVVEEMRTVDERNNGPECCGQVMLKQIPRRICTPAFNGSAAAEIAAEKQMQLYNQCMDEGIQSRTELEEGIAQGIARADRLGLPPERIVGDAVKKEVTTKPQSVEEAAFVGSLN